MGLTQAEVARQVGVSRHLVSDVENGRCASIGVGNLMKIAASRGLWVTLSSGIPVPSSDGCLPGDEQIEHFFARFYADVRA